MTSEEFAALARTDPVVIVPVGALEEHGPHLPLGADMIQPLHVLDEVARRTGAFVAPSIPYGVCTTTRPYPGTVSVSVDSLKAFVRDVLDDFVRNGVHRVMIVSGHAGREHMMALRAAAHEVVDRGTGLKATVLSDYDLIYASEGILPERDGAAFPRRRRPPRPGGHGFEGRADVVRDRGGGEGTRDPAHVTRGANASRPVRGRRGRSGSETRFD